MTAPRNTPPSNEPPSLPGDRWAGITRPYAPEDVERLRGSIRIVQTLADRGARRLWHLLRTTD